MRMESQNGMMIRWYLFLKRGIDSATKEFRER
jgi:hypothetical protein